MIRRTALVLLVLCSGVAHAQGGVSGGGFSGGGVGQPTIGSVTASFTAYPIQGATCVAPCAVYFDAVGGGYLHPAAETTDTAFTRLFHTLYFGWSFDDPGAGTWPLDGLSRDTEIGGIAGHTYYTPGTYNPILTVRNPNGDVDTFTVEIVVADPNTAIPAANTYCFADETTNGSDWTGCNLDCAGADAARCVNATGAGAGSTAFNTTCNGDAAQRRCRFRKGDTFDFNTALNPNEGTTPGLIDAFGTGARPILDLNGNQNVGGAMWTLNGVNIVDPSQGFLGTTNPGASPTGVDNYSLIDVSVINYSSACIEEWMDSTYETDDVGVLHAFVNFDCSKAAGGGGYTNWPGSRYTLWQGGTFDRNDVSSGGSEASVRVHHMQNWLIQHSRWQESPNDTAGGGTDWQLRAWDEWAGNYGAPGTAPSSDDQAIRLILFSDNDFEGSRRGSVYFNVCADSGCNCIATVGTCAQQAGMGLVVDVRDIIWERNFFHYQDDAATVGGGSVIAATGGDLTARNNVVDMQTASSSGRDFFGARGHDTNSTGGTVASGERIHVYNNLLYVGADTIPSAIDACIDDLVGTSTGCVGDCDCKNNLLVHGGSYSADTNLVAASFTGSNNLVHNGNPFTTTPGGVGATTKGVFVLASPNASIIDAGYDFNPATDTDRWVYDDAFGQCRDDGQWDIGAHEFGASAACQ